MNPTIGFRINLSHRFFFGLIAQQACSFNLDVDIGSMYTLTGWSAKDGEESYRLSRLAFRSERRWSHDEQRRQVPSSLVMTIEVEIGEPNLQSFQGPPRDRSGETYWIHIILIWAKIYEFFGHHVTRDFANLLEQKVSSSLNVKIGEPKTLYAISNIPSSPAE